MTVQSNNPVVNYTGNGVTTSFNAPSNCISPPLVALNGVTLTLNSDYTLVSAGGLFTTVLMTVAPANLAVLSVKLNEPFTQLTHWVEGDPFPATSHEAAADHVVLLAQQLQGQLAQAPTLPVGTQSSAPLGPPPSGTVLGWLNGAWTWMAAATSGLQALLASAASGQGDALLAVQASLPGAAKRTQHQKNAETVSILDFGADPTGVANSAAALLSAFAALATVGGGRLFIPAGSYLIDRSSYSNADNITCGNITIYGDGPATKIVGQTGYPNDGGGWAPNIFHATGRSGITIRDMSVSGYVALCDLVNCDNILVENITGNGKLANAAGYLWQQFMFFDGCNSIRVSKCRTLNYVSHVQFAFSAGSGRCKNVIVSGCHFENNIAQASMIAPFPCGVYVWNADEVVITGNTFKNLYSNVANGDQNTGMGYGVYEGDGACSSLVVSGNTIIAEGNGTANMTGIWTTFALKQSITGNTIVGTHATNGIKGIRANGATAASSITVTGNTLHNVAKSQNGIAGFVGIAGSSLTMTGNIINGALNGMLVQGSCNSSSFNVSNNNISNCGARGMYVPSCWFPLISGNIISLTQQESIALEYGTICASVIGNTLIDGNLSNGTDVTAAAVSMTDAGTWGIRFINNTVMNTVTGGGKFLYVFGAIFGVTARMFKEIFSGTNLMGFGTQANHYLRALNNSPLNLFDVEFGEFISPVTIAAAGTPGWYCTDVSFQALTANASNASTTITVADTSHIHAGDQVVLTKTNNPFPITQTLNPATDWFATTVLSVTDGTHFVLSAAIPVGAGTFPTGTAYCKTNQFKAAPVIAS